MEKTLAEKMAKYAKEKFNWEKMSRIRKYLQKRNLLLNKRESNAN